MPIDTTKRCNIHTEEKEQSGECCQQENQEKAEQDTYEHRINTESEPKSASQLLQEGMELQRRLEDE